MSDGKVIGLEPQKYVKITYILLIVSSGVGALMSVLAMLGVLSLLGGIASLAGLIGLIMAVVGWAGFKESFSSLEIQHLKYIVMVFLGFLVINVVISAIIPMTLTHSFILSAILNTAALALLFTGYNSWSHGRTVTKDTIKGEFQAALKRA